MLRRVIYGENGGTVGESKSLELDNVERKEEEKASINWSFVINGKIKSTEPEEWRALS